MITITCTVCGKNFNEWDEQADFKIEYPNIGYGSQYDCTSIKANLCCECFDSMIQALERRTVTTKLNTFIKQCDIYGEDVDV